MRARLLNSESLVKEIAGDKIGVIPTDTIYGLVGKALSKRAVRRIYKLRGRNCKKPMIILIGSLSDLKLFKIKLDKKAEELLKKLWPGKISVILPSPDQKFYYLHRGTKTLAFRLPRKQQLTKLLKKTGPLVAPSANPEGLKPAETAKEAEKYFGDKADFYVDVGKLASLPSTLVAIKNGKVIIKRQGACKITHLKHRGDS